MLLIRSRGIFIKLFVMKKQLLLAMLFTCSALYIASCKKDKDNTPTPTTSLNNASDFVQKHGVQKETFNFNTSELPKTFTLSEGTQVTFQPGSFTVNGVAVTGDLTLEARDIRKRSDAIFTGTNTNHISGRPLVSDGFFYLDVKSNGTSVDQITAVNYNVKMPTTREGEWTVLWDGDVNVAETAQMGWEENAAGTDSVKGQSGFFNFDDRGLGWVNCDIYFNPNAQLTTITVGVPNNPGNMATFMGNSGHTFVLFCPEDQNVVVQLYSSAGTNMVKSYDNTMPVGTSGRLIAFSIKDGKYWFAKQDVTITANMNTSLTLAESTEAAIESEIEALDSY